MFSRARLVVGPTREQEPLPGKFSKPRKGQVSKFGRLVGLVAGPIAASSGPGVLDRAACRRLFTQINNDFSRFHAADLVLLPAVETAQTSEEPIHPSAPLQVV